MSDDEGQYYAQMQAEAEAAEAEASMAAEAEYQQHLDEIGNNLNLFLAAMRETLDKYDVEVRCLGGEIDFLGNGFRLTPYALFEAINEESTAPTEAKE